MSNKFSKFFPSLISGAVVWNSSLSTCWAHPDHPLPVGSSDSLLHYFVQPEHALPFAVFAVAMWWISRLVKSALSARVASKKVAHVEDRR
jgi:hypothetical protein